MGRRPTRPDADVLLGVFPRQVEQAEENDAEAEVIDLVPFLLARLSRRPCEPA
jgi:hypothetical protein